MYENFQCLEIVFWSTSKSLFFGIRHIFCLVFGHPLPGVHHHIRCSLGVTRQSEAMAFVRAELMGPRCPQPLPLLATSSWVLQLRLPWTHFYYLIFWKKHPVVIPVFPLNLLLLGDWTLHNPCLKNSASLSPACPLIRPCISSHIFQLMRNWCLLLDIPF